MSRTTICLVLAFGAADARCQDLYPNKSASDAIGKVATATAVDGTAYVTRHSGGQALLARGASVLGGETVHTTRNSSVRLTMIDGGETVVRPESSLLFQEILYKPDTPAADSLVLNLLRGGLRALTGLVGKRGNPNAYKLRAGTATIGIRGTEFSARLCDKDCAEPDRENHSNRSTPVAARVVQLVGAAEVSRGNAKLPVSLDGPLYTGDLIETGPDAHAVLVFRDEARLTVNPSTRLVLTRYDYSTSPKAEPPSMFVELLRGGLRFATGLIGKQNPRMVKVRTPTATLGIRGTVFDIVCGPTSSPDLASEPQLGSMPCDESLFVRTREGTVELNGDLGTEVLLTAGQSGRVDAAQSSARRLDGVPAFFLDLKTPEPEAVSIDPNLFGIKESGDPTTGVFVMVHEGRIVLSQAGKDLSVDAGESAYAGRTLVPVKLFDAPSLLDRDPFLSVGKFNANMCRR